MIFVAVALAGCDHAAPPPGIGANSTALYGATGAFNRDIGAFPLWQDVMARAKAERSLKRICTSAVDHDCVPREWRDLIADIRDLPLMEKLEVVNDHINQYSYVSTIQNWHRVAYWETPFEFLRHGGQCQDYAIAKYLALREAGVGDDVIRMLVVRDTAINTDHAVLIADVGGQSYLLDNLHRRIRPVTAAPEYRPYYSINLSGYWIYFGGRSMVASD